MGSIGELQELRLIPWIDDDNRHRASGARRCDLLITRHVFRLLRILPLLHEFPEALHVLVGHDLVPDAAEEEHRRLRRDERDLRRRVPLLVAEERERAQHGQRGGHEPRQGEEGVLKDERADLHTGAKSVRGCARMRVGAGW